MYALVTGASSGIGEQYATVLARDYKCDLVLVSNQEKEIEAVAKRLSTEYGVKAMGLYSDLSRSEAPQELYDYCNENNIEIDILINNAGVFFFNEYTKTELRRIELILNLHMITVAKMCRLFGEDMCRRGRGYILNMSSMAAWFTVPGLHCYSATKAFVLNFSRSLWYEMHQHGVTCLAVCPGAVDTGLYGLNAKWRKIAVALHVSLPPEKLAKKALKKLFKGKKQTIPGFLNHIFIPIVKHLPDWFIFAAMKKLKYFQK